MIWLCEMDSLWSGGSVRVTDWMTEWLTDWLAELIDCFAEKVETPANNVHSSAVDADVYNHLPP